MFWSTLGFRLIAYFVVASSVFGAGWFVNGWRYDAKIKDMQAAQLAATIKAEKDARDKEEDWNTVANSIRDEKDVQIKSINSQLSVAINELHKRQSRPAASDMPQNPSVGQGGTGASLYSEDAIFLAGEAARADILRTALDECYKQYDAVSK